MPSFTADMAEVDRGNLSGIQTRNGRVRSMWNATCDKHMGESVGPEGHSGPGGGLLESSDGVSAYNCHAMTA